MPQQPPDFSTWTKEQYLELLRDAQKHAPEQYRELVRFIQSESFSDLESCIASNVLVSIAKSS